MRVGYVLGTYPRATDTFVQREVAAVRDAGIDVQTIAVREPTSEHLVGAEQRQEHERTTYVLAAGPASLLGAAGHLLLRSPGRVLGAARLAWGCRQPGLRGALLQGVYFLEAAFVARAVGRRRLDHLHNHFGDQSGTVTMLAAQMAGVTFSMTIHGPDVFFDRHRWRLDIKAERSSFLACISHYSRSQVMSVAPVESWPRLQIVHCGVTPDLFEEPLPEPGRARVLAVGRLDPVKGLSVLLEAVARLLPTVPALRLDLVGDGPDRARLEAQVRDLGLGDVVRFLGYLSQAEVREEFRRTDVFALTSFAEGVPVVLMEAMAARVPVVASRVMGVPELVQDGVVGHLVPPGDPEALADALQDLLTRAPDARREFGDAGRRVVEEQFDVGREARRLVALFRGAHGERGHDGAGHSADGATVAPR